MDLNRLNYAFISMDEARKIIVEELNSTIKENNELKAKIEELSKPAE